MADEEVSYQGPDRDALIAVACKAVAVLSNKDPERVQPDEDGDVYITDGSAGILVSSQADPPALVFRSRLLEGVKPSPSLYALINEINVGIELGQIIYLEKDETILYYYHYLAEDPGCELVCYIITSMISAADFYDDRLKARFGGKRSSEEAEDEVEI